MAYFNGKRILNARVEGLYEDGYAQGKEEGKISGYNEGFTDGKNEGTALGESIGYEKGYDEGYNAGIPIGFDSGRSIGITEGIGKGEERARTAFWDKYQTGTSPNHAYRYAGFGWTDETYNPIRPVYTDLVSHYIYSYSQITDTKVDIEIHSASVGVFQGADKLKTIRKLIVSDKTTFSSWFANCSALENVIFEGEICSNIDFRWSENLTAESVKSIVEHLKTYYYGTEKWGTNSLTLKAEVWSRFVNTIPLPESTPSWELRVEAYGWNLVLV